MAIHCVFVNGLSMPSLFSLATVLLAMVVSAVSMRMPSGPITPTTVASQAVGGGGETAYGVYILTADSLVAGANQLAVEVHQAGAGSTDIVMDLRLDANVITDVTP